MPALRVDVWSDIACPWCWIGSRRLEAAIARMPSPGEVEVVWRSFELDPKAPRAPRTRSSYAERLAKKYRAPLEQAQALVERMSRIAADDGLTFRLDAVRPGNTFDAHRVLHLARARGVQRAVKERLFRARFGEGVALGDRAALARVAGEAGLDAEEVRRVLRGDAYADAVRADEDAARQLDVHAVPFFGVAEAYAVSGAQSVDVLHGTLMQAWAELPARAASAGDARGEVTPGAGPRRRTRRA